VSFEKEVGDRVTNGDPSMTNTIAAGHWTGLRRSGTLRVIVVVLGLFAVGACAPVPKDPEALRAYKEANDPLEPTNRKIFEYNMRMDRHVMKPIAKAYRKTFPAFVRNSIRNFLDNAAFPQTFINDLLQGKPHRAAETAMRFFVNTVAGVFGFFDVAAQYGLEAHKEDFGQTLAVWGVTEGPYLMIPFLGPQRRRSPLAQHRGFGGSRAQFARPLRHHTQSLSPEPELRDPRRQTRQNHSAGDRRVAIRPVPKRAVEAPA
jgi:hypothetical protein